MNRLTRLTLLPFLGSVLNPPQALAQLASPVATTSTPSSAPAGASQPAVSVPATAAPATFAPTQIASPPADPADASGALAARPREPVPPPVAPSAFEAYVSQLVGHPLHRFGEQLLAPEARDFTAPATTAIPDDYRLNPGDQLALNLRGSVEGAAVRLTIDPEGRIFIPRVGPVMLGGVRYGDAHDLIARAVSRQYRDFDVQVSVARLHGLTVYVTGYARQPGAYTVGSLSTLVNAVMAAGGPASGGSFRAIQLRRNGRLVSDFDLYDLLLRGDKRGDAALQNGDVIYIAPAGEQVAVIGSVNQEAIYEVAPGETLANAVAYAGGIDTVADGSRLMVLDSLDRSQGWVQLGAADARGREVHRGDIVRVLSDVGIARPVGVESVLVTLGGEVVHPGRYYVAPGTRLGAVLALAGGLTSDAFPYASVITRESVKVQQQESYARALNDMEMQLRTQPLVSANRAQLTSAANSALIEGVVKNMRARAPTGRLVFDLPVTAKALPDDLIMENNDTVDVPTRPVTIGVFGSVASPASFAYRPGMTIGDAIALAGGVQKVADKSGVFVVRANGTVFSDKGATRKAPALPGDLVYVPVDAGRGEFWARMSEITSSLFGGVAGAVAIKALAD